MRILVIDKHVLARCAIKRALCEHDVVVETDTMSAMSHFADGELGTPFDLVLCDYDINGMSGRGLLTALRERHEPPLVILMSEYVTLLAAMDTQADAVLCKPVAAPDLRAAIATVGGRALQRNVDYRNAS
jgi:DNA-binding NarL/FixJ family response regulator